MLGPDLTDEQPAACLGISDDGMLMNSLCKIFAFAAGVFEVILAMNRKRFLRSSAAVLALAGLGSPAKAAGLPADASPVIPPYLRPGDLIGITSPAGYIPAEDIQPAVNLVRSWGFAVRIGETVGKKDFTYGGTDEERWKDFQQLLDDREVKAILCARGGYGAVRLIDRWDWSVFKKHPKWIIGFSDITVIHSHLNRQLGIASIHSKMCNSFPADWVNADAVQVDTILSIRRSLQGEKMVYATAASPYNRLGTAKGVLVGGNLRTLESLAGSASDIHTAGKILFVEDTGEYLYSIDRMFWNLKRGGKLDRLKGLVIGGFKVKPVEDPADEFGSTLEQIVLEKVKEYDYPVCFNFPVGHQKSNYALKCGLPHVLTVTAGNCSLTETI